MVTRLRVIVAVLIAGLAAAGCAIPTQNVPSAIPPSRVPFDLLSPNLPTTTTTPQSSVPVKIYLVGPNRRLVGESRVAAFPAPLKTVVAILLEGPIQKETRAGIKTAIPNNVQILSATVSKSPDIATVNFNEAFAQIPAADTELRGVASGLHRGGRDQPDHRRGLPDRWTEHPRPIGQRHPGDRTGLPFAIRPERHIVSAVHAAP